MKVYGHRGAPILAPENTLASFEAAIAAGAVGVECDVRLTADGALVVLHDDDVARTTDGTGLVSAMIFAEVRKLDAGGGQTVPTVEEVLAATGGHVVFEVKGTSFGPVDGRRTASVLARALEGRDYAAVIVSSFDPAVLAVVQREAPMVATGLLATPAFDPASVIAAAVEGKHRTCFLPDAVVDAAAVAAAHAAGLAVIPWTVNDPVRLSELASWGADGAITDDPAGALAALAR